MDSFMGLMQRRRDAFRAARASLSEPGRAFVDRILAEHGFADRACFIYRDVTCAGGTQQEAYRAVYSTVVQAWRAAGYHEVPLRDLWTLSAAEFRLADLLHPSAQYMVGPALSLMAETLVARASRWLS